jgi:hypothetical protein
MPLFAKSARGYLALQADHSQASVRDIKVRPTKVNEVKE